MARTRRNKNTLKSGWEVRDDKKLYYKGKDVYRELISWGSYTSSNDSFFSQIPRYRRSIWRCEKKEIRKRWWKRNRKVTNTHLHMHNWDAIISPKGTSGWETW